MRSMHLSLRFGIPITLLVFTLLLGGWSVYRDVAIQDQIVEETASGELIRRLTSFQGTLDFLFAKDAVEQVQQEIAGLRADHELAAAILLDERDTVIASAQRDLLGAQLGAVAAGWEHLEIGHGLPDLIARVRARHVGEVLLSPGGGWIAGVYPAVLGRAAGELRPSRVGVVLVTQDLRGRKAAARREVWRRSGQFVGALAAFSLLLGIGAHLVVTKQVTRLVDAAKRFSGGDQEARARLAGVNELAAIGAAFDAMADKVAEDQRQLREQGEQIRLLMDSAAEGIFGVDAEGQCTFANRAFIALLGFKEEGELLSKDLSSLDRPPWHTEPAPADTPTFVRRTLREGKATHEEVLALRSDGTTFFAECWSHPIKEGEEVVGAVVTAMDISERKAAEEKLKERLEIIERQRVAIRTLSAPIIEVWDGVLTVPVLGELDSRRAADIMEALLERVWRARCRVAIVDLTGVDFVDTATADYVIRLISAVELLGAQGVVVGIQPPVAQALVSIGADLSRLTTLANLREALLHYMRSDAPAGRADLSRRSRR